MTSPWLDQHRLETKEQARPPFRTQGSQSKLANNFEQRFFDFFSFCGWCHKQESLSPSALISAFPLSLHFSVFSYCFLIFGNLVRMESAVAISGAPKSLRSAPQRHHAVHCDIQGHRPKRHTGPFAGPGCPPRALQGLSSTP